MGPCMGSRCAACSTMCLRSWSTSEYSVRMESGPGGYPSSMAVRGAESGSPVQGAIPDCRYVRKTPSDRAPNLPFRGYRSAAAICLKHHSYIRIRGIPIPMSSAPAQQLSIPLGPTPRGGVDGLKTCWRQDLLSGFPVLLIALPLCLGISLSKRFPADCGHFHGDYRRDADSFFE